MNRSYTPAIDWLKCLGITLILYGHLAGWAPMADLPPIYSKQLGVAFFLFASGYSLSTETRGRWRVAFNRVFEIYLFGVPFALLVTILSFGAGEGLKLSNYLPFLAGANVVFNNFPANPTTWYLGTYIQLILLWTLLARRIRVTAGVLIASAAVEIAVRALLMMTAGSFVAYMLLPNWSTVFLLGCWHGRRSERLAAGEGRQSSSASTAASLVALLASAAGWFILTSRIPFERTLPFMRLEAGDATVAVWLVSTMVSMLYVGATELVYRAVAPRQAPGIVRFVARNTLIIFLVHMPVYYVMRFYMERWHFNRIVDSAIYLVICLPGLALLSEGVRKLIRPRELRQRIAGRMLRWSGAADRVSRAAPELPR